MRSKGAPPPSKWGGSWRLPGRVNCTTPLVNNQSWARVCNSSSPFFPRSSGASSPTARCTRAFSSSNAAAFTRLNAQTK
eukprot:1723888-Alexandrium_andersonii.AAC.1